MRLARRIKNSIIFFLLLLPVLAQAQQPPKRIVSLAPSITESLYQLGVDDALVAVTSYCDYPPQAKTKQIIGTLTNPNIEKIYSLSPDLVLAVNGINRAQTIEKLRSLGIRVVVLGNSNSFADIAENFIHLGRLVGQEQRAARIINDIESELKLISSEFGGSSSMRVFWEVGARPLVSAGGDSFVNEFIHYAGGINIFRDTPVKYFRVSREEVLRRNPEAIMLVTMGDVTEKEKLYWQKFKQLKAVENNKIYIVDADKVCRPTPASFLSGVREVIRLMRR